MTQPENDDAVSSKPDSADSVSGRTGDVAKINLDDTPATGISATLVSAVPPIDELLTAQKHRRWMRNGIALVFGLIAALFFIALLCAFASILDTESLAIITNARNSKGLVTVSVALGLMSAVSLSLMLALVRISADPEVKSESDNNPVVTTAFSECFRAIAEALKSLKK